MVMKLPFDITQKRQGRDYNSNEVFVSSISSIPRKEKLVFYLD